MALGDTSVDLSSGNESRFGLASGTSRDGHFVVPFFGHRDHILHQASLVRVRAIPALYGSLDLRFFARGLPGHIPRLRFSSRHSDREGPDGRCDDLLQLRNPAVSRS